MRITPTAPVLTIPALESARLNALSTGQLLEVLVVQRLDDGRFLLQSGPQRWQAVSQQALTPGEQVLAQVVQNEPGQPAQLAILASRQQTLAAGIREQLPRQQTLTGLTRLLAHMPADLGAALTPLLRQRLGALLDALPTAESLQTPDGLRRQLARSGLFLESGLLAGQPPAEDDLKARLLQLAAALPAPQRDGDGHPGRQREQHPPPTPLGSLLTQAREVDDGLAQHAPDWLQSLSDSVDAGLARLTGHQLQHLQDQSGNQQQWLLELPVRDRDGFDVVQLHIRRERRGRGGSDDADSSLWQLTLSFDFDSTGPMMVRLVQQAGALSIRFHADSGHAWQWIDEQLPQFRLVLRGLGLDAVNVDVQRGMPHQDTLPASTAPLLRTQA